MYIRQARCGCTGNHTLKNIDFLILKISSIQNEILMQMCISTSHEDELADFLNVVSLCSIIIFCLRNHTHWLDWMTQIKDLPEIDRPGRYGRERKSFEMAVFVRAGLYTRVYLITVVIAKGCRHLRLAEIVPSSPHSASTIVYCSMVRDGAWSS